MESSFLAYKGFDEDFKCRDFQYEVGNEYYRESIKLCYNGFHACRKLGDVFSYYPLEERNRYAIVEILGNYEEGTDKLVTNKIRILRELSRDEIYTMVNTGDSNHGYNNTGRENIGNFNSGRSNRGGCNTGSYNKGSHNVGSNNKGSHNVGSNNKGSHNVGSNNEGYYNCGDGNIGDYNCGDGNIGDCNTGNRNKGAYNSGCRNKGNNHNGFFNTGEATIKVFNKETGMTREEFLSSLNYELKAFFTLQGDAGELSLSMQKELKALPFFDEEVFFEITGVRYE